MSLSNVGQSVRDQLLNRARETGENHEALLTRYALERLLYRLGESDLEHRFVLKGAYAFLVWQGDVHRPTRDLDLLGFGDPEELESRFQELCEADGPDDGVTFVSESVEAEPIRDSDAYGGMRVRLTARIAGAKIPVKVDVGFGDDVVPEPQSTTFPTLLDMPAPTVRAYPRETVVAEKLHAMVTLGIANSRMKDFYDVWYLAEHFAFEGPTLAAAIQSTFERRETAIPDQAPVALTDTFASNRGKQQQWRAFLERTRLTGEEVGLDTVVSTLGDFLLPPLEALRDGGRFDQHWSPNGQWQPEP